MLLRYHNGEEKVWSVVHVPSVDAEDKWGVPQKLYQFDVCFV